MNLVSDFDIVLPVTKLAIGVNAAELQAGPLMRGRDLSYSLVVPPAAAEILSYSVAPGFPTCRPGELGFVLQCI